MAIFNYPKLCRLTLVILSHYEVGGCGRVGPSGAYLWGVQCACHAGSGAGREMGIAMTSYLPKHMVHAGDTEQIINIHTVSPGAPVGLPAVYPLFIAVRTSGYRG